MIVCHHTLFVYLPSLVLPISLEIRWHREQSKIAGPVGQPMARKRNDMFVTMAHCVDLLHFSDRVIVSREKKAALFLMLVLVFIAQSSLDPCRVLCLPHSSSTKSQRGVNMNGALSMSSFSLG